MKDRIINIKTIHKNITGNFTKTENSRLLKAMQAVGAHCTTSQSTRLDVA